MQLRSAETGALLRSYPLQDTFTTIGGILDGVVWVTYGGGMANGFTGIATSTGRQITLPGYGNQSHLLVSDSRIVVATPGGGPGDNYCAVAPTGKFTGPLPASVTGNFEDDVVGLRGGWLYYVSDNQTLLDRV